MKDKLNILLVDDDKRMTSTLADILILAGYEPVQAWTANQALELARSGNFDCVLTDIRMPGMSGVEFFVELHKELPGLPVVLMTAYAAEDLIQKGLQEGVIGLFEKPINITQMLGFFSSLAKNNTVAIVDDDSHFCQTLGDILKKRGYSVKLVTDPHTEIESLISDAQIVLLDLKLNEITGLDILQKIHHLRQDIPVLMITAYRKEMGEALEAAMKNSAYACLYKPLEIDELLSILADFQQKRLREALSGGSDAYYDVRH